MRAISSNTPDTGNPRWGSLEGTRDLEKLPPTIHHIVPDEGWPSIGAAIRAEIPSLPDGDYLSSLVELGAVYFSQCGNGKTRRLRRATDLECPAPKGSYIRVLSHFTA